MGVVLGGPQRETIGREVGSSCVGHMVSLLATPWKRDWRCESGGSRAVRSLHCDPGLDWAGGGAGVQEWTDLGTTIE